MKNKDNRFISREIWAWVYDADLINNMLNILLNIFNNIY